LPRPPLRGAAGLSLSSLHHISPAWRNGRVAPIFYESGRPISVWLRRTTTRREAVTNTYTKERQLRQQLAEKVEAQVPGTEVLAVELLAPDRFCVYIDHPRGVDHALCEQVTRELDEYRRDYTIDVSSPGLERPLRTPAHFADAVGRRVRLRTSGEIEGRKKFRGEVLAANDENVSVGAEGGDAVLIPYDQIVRGNLIDEG
jgi:ribosome maturation factor RimP